MKILDLLQPLHIHSIGDILEPLVSTDLLSKVTEFTGATGVALAISNKSRTHLDYIAHCGIETPSEYDWVTLGDELGFKCFSTGEDVYIPNLYTADIPHSYDIAELVDIKTILFIPLIHQKNIMGVCSFYSKGEDTFKVVQIYHVKLFARMIAAILDTEVDPKFLKES